jgi:CRISPR-associated endonuclease/helicase Cas3
LDTGAVCEQLIKCLGCPDGIPDIWVVYLTSLHDIGKADPEFQVLDDDQAARLRKLGWPLPSQKDRFRHESRSGAWIFDYLRERQHWKKYSARIVSDVYKGHHGNFKPRLCADNSVGYEQWELARAQLAEMVADTLHIQDVPFSPEDFEDNSATGIMLIGLTVLSDWIASNEEMFRYPILDNKVAPSEYWHQSQAEAARAVGLLQLESSGLCNANSKDISFRDVWPAITEPYPSQRVLEQACKEGIPPGLVIIEAPMGQGKTESAVYLSEYWRQLHGLKGAYIALPTMATSNQMFSRYREFLSERRPDNSAPRLVHGMAWLLDNILPEKDSNTFGDDPDNERLLAREWFSPSKRALIAPEGVGTIDQALMAALNVKHGFLRLLGLSTKVLVIDEVHAYDEYMTVILERLLTWCKTLRIPVVMLSATLSEPQKKRLVEAYSGTMPDNGNQAYPYPLITVVPLDGSRVLSLPVEGQSTRTVKVCKHSGTLNNPAFAAQLALSLVKNGGCACVLMNTVKQAQAVFKELGKLDPAGEHYLFHAKFPAFRRSEIENQIVALFGKGSGDNGNPLRPGKAILVATQVVEQSLDLDFDVMISQLAPIDLLLQRIGRLRRHSFARPAGLEEALHILMPDASLDFGSSGHVFGSAVLLRTMTVLEDRNQFDFPVDFRPMIDKCYGDKEIISSIISSREQILADEKRKQKNESDAGKAIENLIPKPDKREFALVSDRDVREESEESTASYFSASTRLGGDSCSVLMLENPALIEAARQTKRPELKIQKALFKYKVDIPSWWLADAVEAEGFEPFFKGEKWLRRTTIIPMHNGKWQGVRKGKLFTVSCDRTLGVELQEPGVPSPD